MVNLVSYPSELGQDSGKPQRRFDLSDDVSYQTWRAAKLDGYPDTPLQITVDIGTLGAPSPEESQAITAHCNKTNIAIYRTAPTATKTTDDLRKALGAFATNFGMCRCEAHRSAGEDGLVAIEVVDDGGRQGFIPYTDKALSWHTDGYSNPAKTRIRSVLMHCTRPAASGGLNRLLDPEIAYIRLRDEDPALVEALSNRRTMTIPGFTDEGGGFRPDITGPVISVDRFTGALHMRYTARKRNITWRDTPKTHDAVQALTEILDTDPLIFDVNLAAGEGVICNNVLHNRTAFEDNAAPGEGRLLYRGRYMDRLFGTA